MKTWYGMIFLSLLFLMPSCSSTPKKGDATYTGAEIRIEAELCRNTATNKSDLLDPVQKLRHFRSSDAQVVLWVTAENVRGKHTLRWEWITPAGETYIRTEECEISKEGEKRDKVTASHKIALRGERAAALKGTWNVRVFLDDRLRANKPFILEEGLGDIDGYIEKGPHAQVAKDSSKWGIVIGIEHYKMTFPAHYAKKDAELFEEYLNKFVGVQKVFKYTDGDATGSVLKDFLSRRIHDYVREGDTVYFYYAGHGVPDKNALGTEKPVYILPADGNPEHVSGTAYSLEQLYADLGALKAKEVFIFLDACFTGEAGRSKTAKSIIGGRANLVIKDPMLATKKRMILFSSSRKDQISNFLEEEEHGLFTYFLLKGMIGEADLDKDGVINADELHTYVRKNMEARTSQWRPQSPIMKKSPAWRTTDPLISIVK